MIQHSEDNIQLPSDEYLTAEQVAELRGLLAESAARILENSQVAVTALMDDRPMDSDTVDIAAAESERDWSLRLAGRNQQMLVKIEKAYSRMAEGEYGACEECGEPVGYKRLLVRPVATVCIDCKTVSEQLERRSRTA